MTIQSKLTSFGIIGIAVLVVAVLYLLEITNTYTLPTRGGIEATIQVAVPLALDSWVQQAAQDFNQQHGQIEVKVTSLKGTEAQDKLSASATNLPDVWLAEADFVRAGAGSIPYAEAGTSIAQDSLVWVAVSQRAELEGKLNWQSVYDTALNDLQFRIALPALNSIESIAACMSAAAAYHQQANLGGNLVSDATFQSWLQELLEAVPNQNRHPRDQLDNRPPQADVGLLLNSDWQQLNQENFVHNAPTYNVIFNYPYLIRTNWPKLSAGEANAHQVAAERFRDFLLDKSQQNKLRDYGFEPVDGNQTGQSVRIDDLILSDLQGCWQ